MSVKVHWSTPQVGQADVGHGNDDLLVDEDHEDDIESASRQSSSEYSTNATQSDLVGPGRTIGSAYRRAGRALEIGLSKVIHKARTKRGQDTGQEIAQGALAVLRTNPDSDEDGQGRRRRGTATLGTSRTGSSIRRAFSFSTVSSDETGTNLPGTGRILGNLYSAGGRILESRINRIAIKSGRGPDACAERIRKAVIGEPYLDEELMYMNVKIRDRWKAKDLLEHERVLFSECKRLLRYALSSLRSTHNRAMQHIADLAIEDRYVRTVFKYLQAPRIIEGIRKRELKMHNINSDWFIPNCRKAVACLSDNEVNTTLFRHLRMAKNPQDLPLPLIYYTLEKYLNDPELSFLVVRYLRRMFNRWKLLSFPFDVSSECIARLAGLAYSLPHIVEWDCMDDIFRIAVQSYLNYIDSHGKIAAYNVEKWHKIILSLLQYSHRLPKTMAYVFEKTDVKTLLDPEDRRNQWSSKYASFDALMLPDGSEFDRSQIQAVASLPGLLLSTQDQRSSVLAGEDALYVVPSLTISKYDHFRAFCDAYQSEALERIRSNLSIGPDVITSEILSLRNTDWHSNRGRVDGVAKEPALSFLCQKLVDFSSSSDPEVVSCANKRADLILQLDRYCRRSLIQAFQSAPLESTNLPGDGPQSFQVPDLPGMRGLEEVVPRKWMYRHRTADGDIHVRSNPPYSAKEPCLICTDKNIWEYSLVPDPPEVFCGSQNLILVLEITPGEAFTSSGHRPVSAGTNGADETEFVAAVMYADEVRAGPTNILFHAFTTVTEGATTVEYHDGNGIHTTDHFWVFVLRFDTEEDVEQLLLDKGMFDVTGHCYWMSDSFKPN